MKDWRTRGFVEDSEDEEEQSEESQQVQGNGAREYEARSDAVGVIGEDELAARASVPETGGQSSTGGVKEKVSIKVVDNETSENELAMRGPSQAIATQRSGVTALDTPNVPLDEQQRVSSNSSPLSSSLPDVMDLLRGRYAEVARLPTTATPVREMEAGSEILAADADGAHDQIRSEWSAPQRNFRQRKPIQLNPYQILDGQYLQEMRRHGVRPTRVVLPSTAQREQDQESDSQSVDAEDTQSVFASPPQPQPRKAATDRSISPQTHFASPEREISRSSSPNMTFEDDALPAIEDLLKHRAGKTKVYMGSKRRKLLHAEVPPRRGYVTHSPLHSATHLNEEAPTIHTPLSPASSPQSSPELPQLLGRGGFRFPPALNSPAKPPTPATSSSAIVGQRSARQLRNVISSPNAESPVVRRKGASVTIGSGDDEAEETDSSQPQSEPEENTRGLKVIRRRIKGVLPASWLKLDVQAQQKLPHRKPEQRLHQELPSTAQQPGVARRLVKSSSTGRLLSDILAISSSDESDKDVQKPVARAAANLRAHQATLTQPSRMPSLFPDDDPGDVMEDNTVDFMLPTASRIRHRKKVNSRKRQTRVTEAFDTSTKRSRTRAGPSKIAVISRPRRPKPPKLSIIDAIPSSPEQPASVPAFLKVARRQARRDPAESRHLPTEKNMRLQTREDTQEVQSVLADWHAGKIRRRATSASSSSTIRKPLKPRDTNIQKRLLPFNKEGQEDTCWPLNDPSMLSIHATPDAPGPAAGSTTRTIQPKVVRRSYQRARLNLQEGQLETEEMAGRSRQDRLHFHQVLQQENQDYAAVKNTAPVPLPRNLAELEAQISRRPGTDELEQKRNAIHKIANNAKGPSRRRRLRKLVPKQVDADTATFRQPVEIVLPSRERSSSVQVADLETTAGPILQNLHPWGVPYTLDFDVLPLPIGTYFHATTFVGSGGLNASLEILQRDLDLSNGTHSVDIAGKSYSWGPWSEDLSESARHILGTLNTALSTIVNSIDDEMHSATRKVTLSTCSMSLQTLLDANTRYVSFSDPIDRESMVRVLLQELGELQSPLQSCMTQRLGPQDCLVRIASRIAALCAHIFLIARGRIAIDLIETCQRLLRTQLHLISSSFMKNGLEDIRSFYDNNRRHVIREAGIKDDVPYVESFVILHHITEKLRLPGMSTWDIVNSDLLSSIDTATRLDHLEYRWLIVLSVLPLVEIGVDGTHQSGRRFQEQFDNWEPIKRLVSRAFSLYTATASSPGSTMNEYIRALLTRCHRLVVCWGWRRCEAIVSLAFDFFAKNEYMSLFKEDKFGSPKFLEELATRPSLDVARDEKTFHIFLKLVAVGLRGLRHEYPDKQIRSIVWRWLPNHNRTHDKDKGLRKEDLDALRNQHDLLSTLYWSCPVSARPPLQLIHNLVDHASSHLEACRISIKSWSNLAAFQLSTDEPVTAAEPFAAWLKEILEHNVAQYKSARPELEAQHEAMKQTGVASITLDRLDAMIARNQNGILAALTDAVIGLGSAFKTATNLPAAWTVLKGCNIEAVLALFDAKNKKTNAVVLGALEMLDAFVRLVDRCNASEESQTSNEESQDYGVWPDDEDDAPKSALKPEALGSVLQYGSHLLSTILGSDTAPTDDILTKMTEHWTRLASAVVRHELLSLDAFLSDYGKHSWSQLRDTPQRRKFTPYFLCQIVKQNPSAFEPHRQTIMSGWLCSLVERDAQLKYQHTLTSDLLNLHPGEILLKNLPFARKNESTGYDISMTDLRERRLALLSSVLSNMRNHYQDCISHDPAGLRALRAEYTTILNHVMLQMRRNYEDLRQGDVVTGAYVSFVQTMIEFMQQYTADICSVDRYFTDSSAFPLPAGDPTYLVGRLKGYDGKLHDIKVVKQLIMFMQNVSERAAVDNEQQYLVSQLSAVMGREFGHRSGDSNSLRSVLLQAIFPAYIESSIGICSAWILARPVLLTAKSTFDDVLLKFAGTDGASAQTITRLMTSILSAVVKALSPLEFEPLEITKTHVMSTLSDMLDIATTCIPTVDYVRRRHGVGGSARDAISYLRDFSLFAAKVVTGETDAFPPTNLPSEVKLDTRTVELKTFCARQLQQDLRDKWRLSHGQYSVKRGTQWIDVQVELGSVDEEKRRLAMAVVAFHRALDSASSL